MNHNPIDQSPAFNHLQESLVSLTRDLVLIPSAEANPKERERGLEVIKYHLESLDQINLQEFRPNGIPSLLALPKGIRTPDILLCGHVDVVSHPDLSIYRSTITNGRIYGPGAGDMKGALAVMLELFREAHSQYNGLSLGLVVTSDEETGGYSGIRYLVNEIGLRCGVVLIPDGGSLTEIIVEEKGLIHLRLDCKGHEAHAARPWLGVNPLQQITEVIVKLQKLFESYKTSKNHWHPTCAVTQIHTPNKTINCIPAEASCVFDIRFPFPHSVDAILDDIKELLNKSMNLNIIICAEPTQFEPDPIFLNAVEQVTSSKPALCHSHGGSDGRFFSYNDIPVIISRPLVGNLHTENEWIDIESMESLYKIYSIYVKDKLKL